VDGSGSLILDEAWMGSSPLQSVRLESWPNQQRPPSSAWHLWRKYLKISLIRRGCWLRTPLGHWNSLDLNWEWYYCAQSKQLWRLVDQQWDYFPILNDRLFHPVFLEKGISSNPPSNLYCATVYKRRDGWVCSGFGPIKQPILKPDTFRNYLSTIPKELSWCVENLNISGC
jgi:hypothetical protein